MTNTNIIDGIKQALANQNGNWNEKKGIWDYSATIAERKTFLSKKKLTYAAKIKIDDGAKTVKFSEMLIEAGSGLPSGGSFDGDCGSRNQGARWIGNVTAQNGLGGCCRRVC